MAHKHYHASLLLNGIRGIWVVLMFLFVFAPQHTVHVAPMDLTQHAVALLNISGAAAFVLVAMMPTRVEVSSLLRISAAFFYLTLSMAAMTYLHGGSMDNWLQYLGPRLIYIFTGFYFLYLWFTNRGNKSADDEDADDERQSHNSNSGEKHVKAHSHFYELIAFLNVICFSISALTLVVPKHALRMLFQTGGSFENEAVTIVALHNISSIYGVVPLLSSSRFNARSASQAALAFAVSTALFVYAWVQNAALLSSGPMIAALALNGSMTAFFTYQAFVIPPSHSKHL